MKPGFKGCVIFILRKKLELQIFLGIKCVRFMSVLILCKLLHLTLYCDVNWVAFKSVGMADTQDLKVGFRHGIHAKSEVVISTLYEPSVEDMKEMSRPLERITQVKPVGLSLHSLMSLENHNWQHVFCAPKSVGYLRVCPDEHFIRTMTDIHGEWLVGDPDHFHNVRLVDIAPPYYDLSDFLNYEIKQQFEKLYKK
ncbi:hypothetical protein CASFOL_042512 [Castilleja foliolosa]|uniref:Uncharacterized protein n=1 Tax=Castilleja foliolosa TaxID=1961234 RepID=A0ABD3BAM4_9LAMI